MIQIKKTILTLVALLAVTTGAWAQEQSETIVTTDYTVEGTHFTISNNDHFADSDGMNADGGITVTSKNGETITKVVISCTWDPGNVNDGNTSVSSGTKEITNGGGTITVTGVNASTFTFTCSSDKFPQFGQFVVYYTEASASSGPKVAWDEAKKTGKFTMPGGNVTLEPEYYPQAALAAAPTAINDVPATTDGAIVNAGTVKNIGETTNAQGTVMYHVSQSPLDDAALLALTADQWTADVPTAADLAQGQAYVYYYVRGNDSDNDEENFSDGDILAANALTVTIAAEPTYAVTFADGVNPEPPAEPEWSASPAADVKKGQTVTVTYSGERKVMGVKAEKKAAAPASTPLDNTTTAWTAGTYAVPAGGLTYSDAITVSGDVTLTLTDGETLTLNKGISLASGATLTIEGTGTMAVNGTNESTASTVAGSGTLVLTSGTLNAKGGYGQSLTLTEDSYKWDGNTGASGGVAINGNVTVSGGTVTATGGNGGNLNTVALGFSENNRGGNGGAAISGTVTVNAGGWTATNGSNGTYIGGDDSGCYAGTGGKAVAGTVTDNR